MAEGLVDHSSVTEGVESASLQYSLTLPAGPVTPVSVPTVVVDVPKSTLRNRRMESWLVRNLNHKSPGHQQYFGNW